MLLVICCRFGCIQRFTAANAYNNIRARLFRRFAVVINFILGDLIIEFCKNSRIPARLNRLTRFFLSTLKNKFITNNVCMVSKIFHVIIQGSK
ncbi:hypothetical protein D3C73_914270 [compost metagenome]